jgi:excisionase family DNA binding protein
MPQSDDDELLTPMDAARVLGLSPDMVRNLSKSGRLPTLKTVSGRRLFRRGDVERVAAEREREPRDRRSSVPPVPKSNVADRSGENGAGAADSNGAGNSRTGSDKRAVPRRRRDG